MTLTYKEAFAATNPEDDDKKRDEAARRILAGAAANEAYWNSRSELEALRAQAEGHGVIVRGAGSDDEHPTIVGTGTDTVTVEGSVTEDSTALASGDTEPSGSAGGEPQKQSVPPSPDNPTEAVARLRAQVQALGQVPEA